ncbi:MAG: hypothetical protein NC120_05130 [Ruminococcus sp.]|nr:hypothetical protein [Ruminococcus sp.]
MIKKNPNGMKLAIGDYTLRYIKSYTYTWTPEYYSSGAYTTWDFQTVEDRVYLGTRFSASITTSNMPEKEAQLLVLALSKRIFNFSDYGTAIPEDKPVLAEIDSIPVTVTSSASSGRYASVSFTIKAASLSDDGRSGGL